MPSTAFRAAELPCKVYGSCNCCTSECAELDICEGCHFPPYLPLRPVEANFLRRVAALDSCCINRASTMAHLRPVNLRASAQTDGNRSRSGLRPYELSERNLLAKSHYRRTGTHLMVP